MAYWRATEEKARKPAKKLAGRLHAAFKDRAAPCPERLEPGAPRAGQTVTIVLVGDRVDALSAGGGVGAVIDLEPDERNNLVVWGNGEVITDEYVGARGVVTEIGPVATGRDGERAVLVTVEVWPDGSDAVPEPEATAVPEPEATAVPEPEATAVPEPEATAVPEPEATACAGARGDRRAGARGDRRAGARGDRRAGARSDRRAGARATAVPVDVDGVIRDITSQVEAAGRAGSGTVEVSAEVIAGLARLVPDTVTWVQLREGNAEIGLRGAKWPSVILAPRIDPTTGQVSVAVVVEVNLPVVGSTELNVRPLLDTAEPEMSKLLRDAEEVINSMAADVGLRVSEISITAEGVRAIASTD